MKTPLLSPNAAAALVFCWMAGAVHAQSITLTGDTTPSGNLGASHQGTTILVGNTGMGTLDILDGGSLFHSEPGILGSAAGAIGTATVSGESVWGSRQLVVGQNGTGTLNVNSGSQIRGNDIYIGMEAGSVGTVTLDGIGSYMELNPEIQYGLWVANNQGSGTLKLLNGAWVLARNSMYTATGTPGSNALVQIDGAKSTLQVMSECHLGMTGISTIEITNGGLLYCRLTQMGFGSISLSGTDSRLHVLTNSLSIGTAAPQSNATLTIGDGSSALVHAGIRLPSVSGNINATSVGTLNIEGSANPGTLDAAIFFGENGLGVVNLNHTNATGDYRFSASMAGRGTVNVTAGGMTTLANHYAYSGNTNIHADVLRAGLERSLSGNSDFAVAGGGTLDTNTFDATVNSLTNAGTVTMLAGGTSSTLTVLGNYIGSGGVIAMNTVLGADDSATQTLVVNGDTSGTTTLNIHNAGGVGAPTSGDGILVVDVAGASNGVFSLPAPGYLDVGTVRYFLTKTGNHWYLQTRSREGVPAPQASVTCTPTELLDSDHQVATCTVTLSAPLDSDLPINLNLPAKSPRYTSTCASPLVIAANTTTASCSITAVANITPNDGDVTAQLSVAPPSVTDAYVASGVPAQIVIKDASTQRPNGKRPAIPTLSSFGLVAMALLLGVIGLGRSRKPRSKQS
ncbi:autotransporter outer membrane beta-barrel domain-containing protein [Comamonas sp.]|uniref:autotransporter outer membrane beta-barrel domain-containing protein n=1 Tax=Comamonas sp. TaxID=34028 RepID=UPI002899EA6A|nr:autotransporter outer membrane beta-barrel domain-containing protein [Comamonas sp.]